MILKQNIIFEHRASNIELFRIITMIFIISHHYVVNSGLTAEIGPIYNNILDLKSIFLLIFGCFGKTGINCFVLITGYFMCKSNITLRKFCKLLFEIYFYRIIIWLIFLLTGYKTFSYTEFLNALIPISEIKSNFSGCYIVFFL